MDSETREYLKREISRRVEAKIPLDSIGRRIIPKEEFGLSGSKPGCWMPVIKRRKRNEGISYL